MLRGTESAPAARCVELIEDGAPVALTDVILTKLLQGVRTEREARLLERHMRAFPILRLESLDDFTPAAQLTEPPGERASRSARRSTA